MKKIVVTGCAGFVGSWICDKAISNGYHVIGIDNLASKVNYTPSKVDFHELDLNDNISNIIKDVDFVIHAASYAEIRHNWDNISERQRIFKNNEMATINLLEQMPKVPIIYLSSASVYGSLFQLKNEPLTEEDANPSVIESPYAAAKMACESYVVTWAHKRNTRWYNLRLVNQVGKRIHRGVIVDFCTMANKNKHIHAADNGLQRKNWVSVEDTADAIIRLLDDHDIVPSGIYSVTSSERWSWRDIVDVMIEMYNKNNVDSNPPFTLSFEDCLAGAIGDPVNLSLNNSKLSQFYKCERPVKLSVINALEFIGWGK